MTITIIQNRGSSGGGGEEYDLVVGSIVLWYGVESTVPYGWEIYTAAYDALIMGAASGGISTTKAGAVSHTHTIPATTDAGGSHTHTYNITSNTAGTTSVGAATVVNRGNSSHNHTLSGTSGNNADHTHTMTTLETATNIPPSVRLYYIKRTA